MAVSPILSVLRTHTVESLRFLVVLALGIAAVALRSPRIPWLAVITVSFELSLLRCPYWVRVMLASAFGLYSDTLIPTLMYTSINYQPKPLLGSYLVFVVLIPSMVWSPNPAFDMKVLVAWFVVHGLSRGDLIAAVTRAGVAVLEDIVPSPDQEARDQAALDAEPELPVTDHAVIPQWRSRMHLPGTPETAKLVVAQVLQTIMAWRNRNTVTLPVPHDDVVFRASTGPTARRVDLPPLPREPEPPQDEVHPMPDLGHTEPQQTLAEFQTVAGPLLLPRSVTPRRSFWRFTLPFTDASARQRVSPSELLYFVASRAGPATSLAVSVSRIKQKFGDTTYVCDALTEDTAAAFKHFPRCPEAMGSAAYRFTVVLPPHGCPVWQAA